MSGADRILYDKDIREPLFFFLEETYGKVRILIFETIGDLLNGEGDSAGSFISTEEI